MKLCNSSWWNLYLWFYLIEDILLLVVISLFLFWLCCLCIFKLIFVSYYYLLFSFLTWTWLVIKRYSTWVSFFQVVLFYSMAHYFFGFSLQYFYLCFAKTITWQLSIYFFYLLTSCFLNLFLCINIYIASLLFNCHFSTINQLWIFLSFFRFANIDKFQV